MQIKVIKNPHSASLYKVFLGRKEKHNFLIKFMESSNNILIINHNSDYIAKIFSRIGNRRVRKNYDYIEVNAIYRQEISAIVIGANPFHILRRVIDEAAKATLPEQAD